MSIEVRELPMLENVLAVTCDRPSQIGSGTSEFIADTVFVYVEDGGNRYGDQGYISVKATAQGFVCVNRNAPALVLRRTQVVDSEKIVTDWPHDLRVGDLLEMGVVRDLEPSDLEFVPEVNIKAFEGESHRRILGFYDVSLSAKVSV